MKRIGIVGAGFIAGKHAEGIAQFENIHLLGVTDIVPEKRDRLACEYGAKSYDSYEAMLSDEAIDIVVLCVPSHMHLEFSMQAIRASKPFLLEKPIAMTEEEAAQIVRAAQEARVPMMVGQSLRFKPEYVRTKELILEGKAGCIKQVYAARLGQRPSWGAWYGDAKKSGGVLYNIMLHDIDYLYSIFGEVESVYAVGTKAENGGYEDIMATIGFACGVKAVVDGSSMMNPGYPFTMLLRVDGSKGTIEYRFIGGENTEVCRVSELRLYEEGRQPAIVSCQAYSNHGRELSYFAECVERGVEPLLCLPHENVEVIGILKMVEQSLESGDVVVSAT